MTPSAQPSNTEQALAEARECLQAIADFDPRPEVVYDDFAYNRLLKALQEAAQRGLENSVVGK